jgi:hypothetical protein
MNLLLEGGAHPLGFAWARGGHAGKAVELLAGLAAIMETSKNVAGQVITGTILAEAYLRSGELKAAEKTLQKCLVLATSSGMKFYVGWIPRLLGEVALESNPHQATEFWPLRILRPQYRFCATSMPNRSWRSSLARLRFLIASASLRSRTRCVPNSRRCQTLALSHYYPRS